jgi:hypothetical protein
MHELTNREQHELAAKAAGYTLTWKEGHCKGGPFEGAFIGDQPWRPKEDDGDALRLAVNLYLWEAIRMAHRFLGECPDMYAATRRAIFHAAVELGKEHP